MDLVTLDTLQLAGIVLGTLAVGLIVGAAMGHHASTIDHQTKDKL